MFHNLCYWWTIYHLHVHKYFISPNGKSADEVAAKQLEAMDKVAVWLGQSWLTLNTHKTVSIYFTKHCKPRLWPNIYVNGQMIKNAGEFKYLGVILDPNLTFKKYFFFFLMAYVLRFNISKFRHIRNSLTTKAAKTYLNAMIVSYMRYCMPCRIQASQTAPSLIRSLCRQALWQRLVRMGPSAGYGPWTNKIQSTQEHT